MSDCHGIVLRMRHALFVRVDLFPTVMARASSTAIAGKTHNILRPNHSLQTRFMQKSRPDEDASDVLLDRDLLGEFIYFSYAHYSGTRSR